MKAFLIGLMALSIVSVTSLNSFASEASIQATSELENKKNELKRIQTELQELRGQLDRARTYRTTGVMIGLSVSVLGLIATTHTTLNEGIDFFWAGRDISKFTTTPKLFAASVLASGATMAWYYFKSSQIDDLNAQLEKAQKVASDLIDALAATH